MSQAAFDTLIDVTVLEDYDFPVPCEYSGHMRVHLPEDPGKYFIQVDVMCGCSPRYIMCESGLQHLNSRPSLNCEEHGTGQLYRITVLDNIK